LTFWDEKDYKKQYGLSILDVSSIIETKFIAMLERVISRELKGLLRKDKISDDFISKETSKKETTVADEDGNDNNGTEDEIAAEPKSVSGTFHLDDKDEPDSEGEQDEGDFTSSKSKELRKQKATYDEDADEVEQDINEEEIEDTTQESGAVGGLSDSLNVSVTDSKYVSNFRFDKNGKWCDITLQLAADTKKLLMVSLTEQVTRNVVIHSIRGIDRCFPQQNETENDTSVNFN
jgi:DNA-directed RNA polymerase I subunit RPA1